MFELRLIFLQSVTFVGGVCCARHWSKNNESYTRRRSPEILMDMCALITSDSNEYFRLEN